MNQFFEELGNRWVAAAHSRGAAIEAPSIEPQVALQDSLRALHQFASFKLLHELRVLHLEPRHLNLRADQKTDHRYQSNLPGRVRVRLAMLQINHADHAPARKNRNR